MKRLTIILLLICTSCNVAAFCVINHTNTKFEVELKYEDWWFRHSYTVDPFEKFCSMEGLDPNKQAIYRISDTDKTSEDDELWNEYYTYRHGSTQVNITIDGFLEYWDLKLSDI